MEDESIDCVTIILCCENLGKFDEFVLEFLILSSVTLT